MVDELRSSMKKAASRIEEEIDLIEIAAILWSGKWLILAFMVVFTLVSFVALKFRVPTYQVEAILSPPSIYQVKNTQPSILSSGAEYQVDLIDADTLYAIAVTYLNSFTVQKLFWESFSGEELNIFDTELNASESAFRNFVGSIQFENISRADSSFASTTIVMNVKSPEEGVNLLGQFIAYVDQYAVKDLQNQMQVAYTTNLEKLKLDYESIKKFERRKMEDELTRLDEAYEIAKSLDIVETPYNKMENIELKILDNRLYLLGTQVLSEERKSLNARLDGPLLAFVPRLREMERSMEQIESDLERLDTHGGKSHAFSIVVPPQSSVNPIDVSKVLVLIVTMLLAGLLGVVLVLILYGIKIYKIRQLAG